MEPQPQARGDAIRVHNHNASRDAFFQHRREEERRGARCQGLGAGEGKTAAHVDVGYPNSETRAGAWLGWGRGTHAAKNLLPSPDGKGPVVQGHRFSHHQAHIRLFSIVSAIIIIIVG